MARSVFIGFRSITPPIPAAKEEGDGDVRVIGLGVMDLGGYRGGNVLEVSIVIALGAAVDL